MLSSTTTGAKTLINPNTPELSSLEYHLRLSLKSSTARIITCHRLSNPNLNSTFSKYSNESLTLDSYVDFTELVGGNTEEDVIKRGFQLSAAQKGLTFTAGSLIPKDKNSKIHKALLCKVVVGRSYVIDKSLIEETDIPEGYNSFHILDDSKTDEYQTDYFIKNTSLVLPKYLIQYEYDPKYEVQSREKPLCANCETEIASCFCEADKSYLCKKCDGVIHQSKIASQHVRKPIGEGLDVFGNCKHHPIRQIQYFCSQCHEPVCIDCTIMGSHAKVEERKHTLVPVEDYFKTVLQETQLPNINLENRRTLINDQIQNIQSRAEAVVEMGKQLTNEIDEICNQAKKECSKIIEKKVTVLLGDELECRRQMNDISRLEEFLQYQQDGSSLQCVYTWHLHQLLREQLSDFKFFRQEIDVQLDAKVNGNIHVIIDNVIDNIIQNQNQSPTKRKSNPPIPQQPPQLTPLPQHIMSTPPRTSYFNNITPRTPNYEKLGQTPHLPQALMSGERKVERRVSDFFHETMNGALDDVNDDFDVYSQVSSRY
ncbi:hypothetical protein BC833DRAFT_585691 [Globomyces pollinis-pini]|nr:hypothetical protein BC833DRAFT_585691 [Globomyces pollinis-pini]